MSEEQPTQPTPETPQDVVVTPETVPLEKKDTDAIIDAIKELTKVIGSFQETVMKKLNAGKF